MYDGYPFSNVPVIKLMTSVVQSPAPPKRMNALTEQLNSFSKSTMPFVSPSAIAMLARRSTQHRCISCRQSNCSHTSGQRCQSALKCAISLATGWLERARAFHQQNTTSEGRNTKGRTAFVRGLRLVGYLIIPFVSRWACKIFKPKGPYVLTIVCN